MSSWLKYVLMALALMAASDQAWPGLAPKALAQTDKPVGVPVPVLPRGRGERCVADTDFMRRYHMDTLSHQRDETVHQGVRTKQFSLNECITCHAVNGADAKPITSENPKHFCRVCHDYAAVKIDCFECHASRPDTGAPASLGSSDRDAAALASYLTGGRQ